MRVSNLVACAIVTVMLGAVSAEAKKPCASCQEVTVRFFKAIGAADCYATPELKVPEGLEKFQPPGYHFFDIHRKGMTNKGTLGVDHKTCQVISFVLPRLQSPVRGKLLAFRDLERLGAGRLLATLDAAPPGWTFRCRAVKGLTQDGIAALIFEPAKEVSNVTFVAPFNPFINVRADTGEVLSGACRMPTLKQLEQFTAELPSPAMVDGAVAKLRALRGFPKNFPVLYIARIEGSYREQGLITWLLTAIPDRRQNNAMGQSWVARMSINKNGFTKPQMLLPLELLGQLQSFDTVLEYYEPEITWNRLVRENAVRRKQQGAGVSQPTFSIDTGAAEVLIRIVLGTIMTSITQTVNIVVETVLHGGLLRNLVLAAAGLGLIVFVRARGGKHRQTG